MEAGRHIDVPLKVQVEALDRRRLLSDVTRVFSDEGVDILSVHGTTSRDRLAVYRFGLETADPRHLEHLLNAIHNVDGVIDCYRVTS